MAILVSFNKVVRLTQNQQNAFKVCFKSRKNQDLWLLTLPSQCCIWPQAICMRLCQTNQRWFGSRLHKHLHCIKQHSLLIYSVRPVCGHHSGPNTEGELSRSKCWHNVMQHHLTTHCAGQLNMCNMKHTFLLVPYFVTWTVPTV